MAEYLIWHVWILDEATVIKTGPGDERRIKVLSDEQNAQLEKLEARHQAQLEKLLSEFMS